MYVVTVYLNNQQILQSSQLSNLDAAAKWRHELGNRLIAEGWIHNMCDTVLFLANSRVTSSERLDNGMRSISLVIEEQEAVAYTPNEAVARIALHLKIAA